MIEILDNGAGMNLETLEDINKKLKNSFHANKVGFGIFNVNERIKMLMGDKYGLSYTSVELVGTIVTIIIEKRGV